RARLDSPQLWLPVDRRRRRRRARGDPSRGRAPTPARGRGVSASTRVLVAMSGGVDSSVAAALLVEQGHDVTGVTLKLWGGESDSGCCSVVDAYVAAYADGLTPNPCVECNRVIKFGRLLERADALGFETVATGHHARVRRDTGGRWQLLRGS